MPHVLSRSGSDAYTSFHEAYKIRPSVVTAPAALTPANSDEWQFIATMESPLRQRGVLDTQEFRGRFG